MKQDLSVELGTKSDSWLTTMHAASINLRLNTLKKARAKLGDDLRYY